ncbi:MAG TPA: hypothetical protein VLE91_04600 [Candidatus Saccharimonadales bacterium]|nr:hypothetical protein [Candidatus Saccharimonadales bacterium]
MTELGGPYAVDRHLFINRKELVIFNGLDIKSFLKTVTRPGVPLTIYDGIEVDVLRGSFFSAPDILYSNSENLQAVRSPQGNAVSVSGDNILYVGWFSTTGLLVDPARAYLQTTLSAKDLQALIKISNV